MKGFVNCVRFNEESTVVLSGSVDTCVKIWDTKSRSTEPIQTLDDATVNYTFIFFLNDQAVSTAALSHRNSVCLV